MRSAPASGAPPQAPTPFRRDPRRLTCKKNSLPFYAARPPGAPFKGPCTRRAARTASAPFSHLYPYAHSPAHAAFFFRSAPAAPFSPCFACPPGQPAQRHIPTRPQAPTRPAQRPTPAAQPKRKKPRLSSRSPACAAKRRFLFYTPVLGFCFWPASPAGAGAVPSPSCAALLPFGVLCQTKNAPFPLAGPARPYCPHPAFRPAPSRASGPHNGKPRTRRLYACTAPKMMVRAASPLYLLFPVPSVFLTSALFFVCCAAL